MTSENKRAVLAAGSGFLGRTLAGRLAKRGWEVVVLTRRPEAYRGEGRAVFWDGRTIGAWANELEGARALVNLTGKNVNCRPTARNEREILTSRVASVRVLGQALAGCRVKPAVWVQCSSLAIYGDPGDRICDENAPVAEGYPASVCTAWEEALDEACPEDVRNVILRIGFVMGRDDGALPFLARLVRLGLGGSIGNGRQWISWIHLRDMSAIFLQAIADRHWSGVFNVTTPEPVTNRELMKQLRRTLDRPWSPPALKPFVWLGGWVLDSDPRVGLSGRRCVSSRLEECGFSFVFPNLAQALGDLFPSVVVDFKPYTNNKTERK
ncbi:MAG: TIGR01777 family oxidoreductase [Verrucomicrobiota bacterium]